MPVVRSSRELAQRVDTQFHKRRNRFRYGMWLTGVLVGAACLAWLAVAGLRGQQGIYQPGPLSTAHQMFNNDCAKCHDKWAPLSRLTSMSEHVTAAPNEKCLSCHDGPAHHEHQIPAHAELKCATCHNEHRGNVQLASLADRHCINCHGDLKNHGHTGAFAQHIDSFDGSAGRAPHPEFALHREGAPAAVGRAPKGGEPRPIVCPDPAAEPAPGGRPQNPDAARIRFNHKAHLQHLSAAGKLKNVDAWRDGRGKLLDCESCHQMDSAGRYMQPIRYDRHCASCHPLLFDNSHHPGKSVPHQAPCVVRGFLTDLYTLDVLGKDAEDKPVAPRRIDPGLPSRGLLTEEAAGEVDQRVKTAEKQVLQHMHTLFGWEAGGGCRYCHDVAGKADDANWAIHPPQIPDRWYVHSRFRHDSHRMLDCNACHRDYSQSAEGTPVAGSEKTSDVLLPPIGVCRECHTSRPQSANLLASIQSFTGARTNCVECHTYHKQDGSEPRGKLGLDLQPMKEESRETRAESQEPEGRETRAESQEPEK